jgi:hypothetical protein
MAISAPRFPTETFNVSLRKHLVHFGMSAPDVRLNSTHARPPRRLVYYLLFATGISCYLLARHFGGQGKVHTSSSLHTGLHFIGNLSNLVLYAGLNAAAVRATFPFAASQ